MFVEVLKVSGVSPLIDSWFLMSGPLPVLSILGVYLYFVLWAGPRWMAGRPAFKLQRTLVLYNLAQVIPFRADAFRFVATRACSTNASEEFTQELWHGAWWYFFSKVTELLDTVFFVLRKKDNQITFLHVYHHTFMVFGTWGYLKFIPGEQGVVIGFLNSSVHIVMYSYYLIAALGPSFQKYLWWKRYMTWLQLVQFVLMLVYFGLILMMSECKLPKGLSLFAFGSVAVFLVMFANFYRNTYWKKTL